MKIVLTGARGLLGSALSRVFIEAGHVFEGVTRDALSGRSPTDLAPIIETADVLVHAAANTNVEQCELEPDTCYRDNFLLTETLAQAASLVGAKVVYVSSTGVYGSHAEAPYREYSEVRPPTHHHRAKHLGELAVMAQDRRNLIVRTGWLFGGQADLPKNFVARRIDEARDALSSGSDVASNTEQRGVPTYNVDVARRILLLLDSGSAGLFNCVNRGTASRFEYVSAIVEGAALPVSVVPTVGAAFNRRARVSPNEAAVNWRMDCLGMPPMPEWRDSLRHYISASGLRGA